MTVVAGEVLDGDGELWITAPRASHYLGPDVRPANVRDWHRRGLLAAHEHRKVGFRRWYRLSALERVEASTADHTKARRGDHA